MDAAPELVADRLLEILRAPFEMEDSPSGLLTLTASIGIAAGLRPTATELLRDADIALYRGQSEPARTASSCSDPRCTPRSRTAICWRWTFGRPGRRPAVLSRLPADLQPPQWGDDRSGGAASLASS